MTRRLYTLEHLTVAHVGLLVAFATWALGGSTAWAQTALSIIGSMGIVITVAAVRHRWTSERGSRSALHWLWPLAALNCLVLLSVLHPLFRSGVIESAEVLIPT